MPTYDEVPYPGLSYVGSHPDALATLAGLLGLSTAPVTACRVLEIGCATGSNIIPMADVLPGSRFVGIDYSARQIAIGHASLAGLGLRNIELRQLNILDITPELGEFDYIIAHGIYSWVPQAVRDRLMETCRQNLAPDGIAYVSYNTYPGWHMLKSVRELMLFHVREVEDPQEKVGRARAVLKMLAESLPNLDQERGPLLSPYGRFMEQEMAQLEPRADAFLLHDHLEDVNDPVYFHEFVAHAEEHGLQTVTDVDFRRSLPDRYPSDMAKNFLGLAGSAVEHEQYVDFLCNRTFRQTLLCHQGRTVRWRIRPEDLQRYAIASSAVPESATLSLAEHATEKFKATDGATLAIDHPLSKAAMLCLAEIWPSVLPFAELRTRAEALLMRHGGGAVTAENDNVLAVNLLKGYVYSKSLVEVRSFEPPVIPEVSDRPVASRWARRQAAWSEMVTNLRHERVELDPFARILLPLLDGSLDGPALAEALLAGPVAQGTLRLSSAPGEASASDMRQLVAEQLSISLPWLAWAGLLVA